MTRDEADAVLYLVDQLRARGATAVDVAGVKASFLPARVERPDRPPKAKSFHDRLFRHIPTGPQEPTRQERLKRKVEA